MTEREYIIIRTLENKIAVAENNNQNILFITRDVMKEILFMLKVHVEKDQLSSIYGVMEDQHGKTI